MFILAHIPPGEPKFSVYEFNIRYQAVVERFTKTIKMHFMGHTHYDQWKIVKGIYPNDDTVTGVFTITPSLTTYPLQLTLIYFNSSWSELNPSFRVYEFDQDTNILLNLYNYRLNLAKWNNQSHDHFEFDLIYDYLSYYNVSDMSLETQAEVTEKLKVIF